MPISCPQEEPAHSPVVGTRPILHSAVCVVPERQCTVNLVFNSLYAASSTSSKFVDLSIHLSAWAVLLAAISALIAFDLWRHRDDHEPTPREAAVESAGYVVAGIVFGVYVYLTYGSVAFGEYMSGYVIEKSLSVDNVFVWSVIFSSFAIPLKYQHRVLFWGIFGALVLRAIFVFAGSALIEAFWWMLLVFGVILIGSGIKVMRHKDDEGEYSHSRAVSWPRP